ncbi:hypothetical protein AGMMS50293_19930 [Spirochaetia bacterium]|nr:hypothetical protein AGMMS50293_19930 [Spirochaetia bacterium]
MKKQQILKYFLQPIFKKYGYEKCKTNFLCFNKNNIYVSFEFLPMDTKVLETTIKHPKIDDIVRFPALIAGPEIINWDNGLWMGFDDIEELIGLIEFQTRKFEEWIFDFLSEKAFVNVFEILNDSRKRRIKEYKMYTQEEKSKILDKARECAQNIFNLRYSPQNWYLPI